MSDKGILQKRQIYTAGVPLDSFAKFYCGKIQTTSLI
jgi:hypothetical protein